jgi:hypothetical protein
MSSAQSASTNLTSPGMPFVVGRPLRANEPIFGRDPAFRAISAALASYSSLNIIGERRMGKTSLLTHLRDNPAYIPQAPAGRPTALAFLDLQDGIADAQRFYGKAVRTWLAPLNIGQGSNTSALESMQRQLAALPELDADGFDRALDLLSDPQGANVRPVLVLDEFERLLELVQQGKIAFPDFFNNFRARITAERLAMVVASRRPLSEHFSDPQRPGMLTSTFPSYFQPFFLRELDGAAADTLLLQPCAHMLTLAEVTDARRWAQDHPCRLQVAGAAVFEAKRDGMDTAWARARRDELARQACMVVSPSTTAATVQAKPTSRVWGIVRAIFLGGPIWIGRMVQKLGEKFDEMAA